MKNLELLAKECMRELDTIGVEYGDIIQFKVNSRAKSRWGQCKKTEQGYIIEISNDLLKDDVPNHATKSTLFHELAHSVDGCMNHGHKWLQIVDLINDCYGYNITTTSRSDEGDKKGATLERKPIKRMEYKYWFECNGCGQVIKRKTMSNFVTNTENYRCGRCGCKFKRVL